MEINETASDVIRVAVGDERQVFEEYSDVGDGWYWSDTQLITIVLVV